MSLLKAKILDSRPFFVSFLEFVAVGNMDDITARQSGLEVLKPTFGKVIFCVGLFRSGSTWAFNIVLSIIKHSMPSLRVKSCYAEQLEDVLYWLNSPDFDLVVVKSHCQQRPMLSYILEGDAPVILTVRDARDCLTSWLQHFGGTFKDPEQMFMRACVATVELKQHDKTCLLKYENGSTRMVRSVSDIARALGLQLSVETAKQIFDESTPEAIAKKISGLVDSGRINAANTSSRDATLMWSKDHVGDGRTNKFLECLNETEVISANYWSGSYADTFGYESGVPEPIAKGESVLTFGGRSRSLYYLRRGFSQPEDGFIWTDGPLARIEIPLNTELSDRLQCEFHYLIYKSKASAPVRFSIALADEIIWNSRASSEAPNSLGLSIIDPRLRGQTKLTFSLIFQNPSSPREEGLSTDDRQLGLALKTIVLRY